MVVPARAFISRCLPLGVLLCVLTCAAPAHADDAILYRVFLLDGSNVVSYGEYAHTAGAIVFSMPLSGLETESPQLQLVSLPESVVDWSRTETYAEAARARHFTETRGAAAFSQLSEEVAATLSQIAFTEDPGRRLAIADRARHTLADWPAKNYGYRANDVAQLAAILDEVVSELRVAAGQSRFDLSLVANATPPPPVPLLPPPTLRESIEQAFMLTRASHDSAERAALLGAIVDALAAPSADGGWAAALRARANADLITATRIDQAYANLAARTLRSAGDKLRKADVKGMEKLLRSLLEADDRLGRQRPRETAAVLATLDLRLDAARRLRLASDRWSVQQGIVRGYQRKARPALDLLDRKREALELIRQLAGPSPGLLRDFQKAVAVASREFSLIKPATDLEAIHGLLTNALQMALRAADTRAAAIAGNDMGLAWQASSAAAGALLLLDKARGELQRLAIPPTP